MPGWLRAILPAPLERLAEAMADPTVLLVMTIVAVALLVVTIVGTPWVVCRLPRDYFKRRYDIVAQFVKNPTLRVVARIAKNILGVLFLIAGVLMLVAPGPGIICLLVALMLLDFPGRHRFERKLAMRPRVLKTMNKLRRRMGKEPLVV